MKNWAPSIEALEEKIAELIEDTDNSQTWLKSWETGRDRGIEKAIEQLERVRKEWDAMKEKHLIKIDDNKKRVVVLTDTINKLKGDQ